MAACEEMFLCDKCGDLYMFGKMMASNSVTCGGCRRKRSIKKLSESTYDKAIRVNVEKTLLRSQIESMHALAKDASGSGGVGDSVGKSKDAVVNEECPKCGHPEQSYTTAQLRGLDEGQTIFMTCLKCGHKQTVHS